MTVNARISLTCTCRIYDEYKKGLSCRRMFSCSTQNQGSCAYGDDGSILKIDAIDIAENVIHVECARVAWCVTQYVLQFPLLVLLDCDDTMKRVDAWVARLDGLVDVGARHIASKLILS